MIGNRHILLLGIAVNDGFQLLFKISDTIAILECNYIDVYRNSSFWLKFFFFFFFLNFKFIIYHPSNYLSFLLQAISASYSDREDLQVATFFLIDIQTFWSVVVIVEDKLYIYEWDSCKVVDKVGLILTWIYIYIQTEIWWNIFQMISKTLRNM